MHTIDFESADFRKPEEKSPPLKSEPQPAESLVSENSRAQEIDSINTRIEEIQASPLWKKVFLRGTLEKELNELYRKRRELGGTETPLSETPDTSVLAKVSRYGALTKKAAREGFFEAPHTNETADGRCEKFSHRKKENISARRRFSLFFAKPPRQSSSSS